MMLHYLKNDEILPCFWNRRSELTEPLEVTFLDLDALKRELREEGSHVAKSDAILEAVLYGTSEAPHFSGWTLNRLNFTCLSSGFKELEHIVKNRSVVTALAPLGQWTTADLVKAQSYRRQQKIWQWRKALRSKAAQIKAKTLSAFARSPLKGHELWLNLGAGSENYPGYIKVDLAGQQHVYDNIVTLSKFSEHSVSQIYCNHVLEHIPISLIEPMLKRWREILKPGGKILARAPDARRSVLCLNETWEEASDQTLAAFGLPNYLEREKIRTGKLDDDACIQMVYGWSNSTPHSWDMSNQHKSLWTPLLAKKRFEAAGFDVKVAENLGTLNTLIVARAP